jgi:hypothetical protein
MATVRSSLTLLRTDRRRPEYALHEDGVVAGTVAWGARPRTGTATVAGRTWELRCGAAAGCVEAWDDAGRRTLHLHAGGIAVADDPTPALVLRRHRLEPTTTELAGPRLSVALRPRHRTRPGLDIRLDGELQERELVLLLAGYELLA